MRLFMKLLSFRLFAFCMALFWVPATAHCRIESLGLDFVACAGDCHNDTPPGASHEGASDACDIVEDGLYKCGSDPLKVAPALVAVCVVLLYVPEPDPDIGPDLAVPDAGRPREWVASWQFVRRAAAPAHAPDSLIA